jgi:hypothetical protein
MYALSEALVSIDVPRALDKGMWLSELQFQNT